VEPGQHGHGQADDQRHQAGPRGQAARPRRHQRHCTGRGGRGQYRPPGASFPL
jgi:hypothetical protein